MTDPALLPLENIPGEARAPRSGGRDGGSAPYAELCVTSNFTFLTGASHPEELVARAAELGLSAIALTDRNSLAGVVRAHAALRELRRTVEDEAEKTAGEEAGKAEKLRIRSQHRTDSCSRQEVGDPQDVARPSPPPSRSPGTPPGPALPRLVVGARLVLADDPVEWLALPTDRAAYHRLAQLLSLGKRRAAKGRCHLTRADLVAGCAGMILIALPPAPQTSFHAVSPPGTLRAAPENGPEDGLEDALPSAPGATLNAAPSPPHRRQSLRPADAPAGASAGRAGLRAAPPSAELGALRASVRALVRRYPGHVFLGAAPRYDGSDQAWFDTCAALALELSAPMVAVGDVLLHRAHRRRLADVLTCLRKGLTIDRIGTRALPNAERRLKPAHEMAHLFRHHPAAIRRSTEIAARCAFSLDELSYEYPDEVAGGEAPQARLERLAHEGLARRCPDGIPDHYRAMAAKELALIGELGFAAYFLTVHDIVGFARSRGILCQGRGSAANSILCWALGITDVSPEQISMVFERFVSRYRGEPPDIDVDFEHERREEVIQHIYDTYGRHRAGLCATVIHFRTRAAIREVGKVMGLSEDVTASLSGQIWGISGKGADPARVRELGLDPGDRRLAQTLELISEIIGFPRHLSQHVGGFVITRGRLDALCPIENAAMEGRTIIEWDKDDIDTLGILKVDVLSLGMLTCLRKAFDLMEDHEGVRHTLDSVPQEDGTTYAMLQRADAVGVFQVESRAQMNFLPRMQPKTFYDLVIEVAIVRPGPIQGGMVQPYIRRRQGLEKDEPFGPALEAVTRKTLGVPLFQEQAMQIAVVGAGYSPEEADRLRRSLASFRRMGTIGEHRDRFVAGMMGNGYTREVAESCFSQIEGFADYGFPESHAAAFAMLTYVSSWLKCHHPAIFACALLNSQPMGFYAPAQIVRDLRDHGHEVRPVCVNRSGWDNTLERRADGRLALRLGFRQVKGLREEDAGWIIAARGNGYPDPESLWLRAGTPPHVLERLAEADAFAGQGVGRRDALWAVRAIRAPAPLPLFSDPLDGEGGGEPGVALPAMHLGEEVVEDYVAMRLSLRAHPMEILRPALSAPTLSAPAFPPLVPHERLATPEDGSPPLAGRVTVAGLVITRQRPGTSSGVIFLTLEDETGVSNIVVWPRVYERFRRAVMGGRLLRVIGKLEREGLVVHVIAERIEDISPRLADLGHPLDGVVGITRPEADDAPRPRVRAAARHPREQAKRLFPSRDFH